MSLRFRLTAISVLLVALGLLGAGIATRHYLDSFLVDRVDQQFGIGAGARALLAGRQRPRRSSQPGELPAVRVVRRPGHATGRGRRRSLRRHRQPSHARFPRLGPHRHLDDRRLPGAGRRRGIGGPTGLDRVGIGHAGDRGPARRRPQHRAAADDDRAAGRRDRAGGRGCARADPGAGRPAPAGPDRADGRGDRRRRPLAAHREQRSAHRGRPAGCGAQRDAGADRARVRRAGAVGEPAAPVRRRCLARAADAADVGARAMRSCSAAVRPTGRRTCAS